jgi:2-aminoadipate transaminase
MDQTSDPAAAERYARMFARPAVGMRSSAIRDLLEVAGRPEVISLAGGFPDTTTFSPQAFAVLMDELGARWAHSLQYGPTEGLLTTRECIVEVMAAEGMTVTPESVLVCTGAQQALDLVCRVLVDPGDVVIVEGPTYPGIVPVLTSCQAEVVQIEMDADGMHIDLLEEAIERLHADGRTVKLIYTVPTFQNPAGVTLSLDRRRRLVEIARENELLVLEDNPYGLLRYDGDPLPPLWALDGGESVLYAGSFSKILAPGLRLGWCAAPGPVLDKLRLTKQAADACTGNLSQDFAAAWFGRHDWRSYVAMLRDIYRRRRDTMLAALAHDFPSDASWTHPEGGLFLWATLPDRIDTTALLQRALRSNVAFVPGRAAYLDGRGGSCMRLSFSAVCEDDIREGIASIARLINA